MLCITVSNNEGDRKLRHVGIAIKKNELWYSVISGTTKADCVIEDCGKLNFQADQDFPGLMLCFHSLFNEVISFHNPDTVAIKTHLDSKLGQIPYMHCSIGVLGYLCKTENIQLTLRSSAWITGGKKAKMIQCENRFPSENLKFEKLAATLVAWFQFQE